MMKKFIMSCPFQPKGGLKRTKYEPSGNSKLEYGETRFPVIPMMNAYIDEGETAQLILICSDNDNVPVNKEYLEEEIKNLEGTKHIKINIEPVPTKYSETINTQLQLYADLVAQISDGDELYVCATFGTKPTPIIQNMAVRYACKAMTGVTLGCEVYGQMDHALGKSFIFDITALQYMEDISDILAAKHVLNPAEKIQEILNL